MFGKNTATTETETGQTDERQEIICAFCGQPIEPHEIATKTARKIKQNGTTNYFHKKCWRRCKNEIKHKGFGAFR